MFFTTEKIITVTPLLSMKLTVVCHQQTFIKTVTFKIGTNDVNMITSLRNYFLFKMF